MTHKALLRQLQISCLGLDAVDPLRLLVDDVIAALAQPPQQEPVKDWVASHNAICALLRQAHDALALTSYPPRRTWVGLTRDEQSFVYSSLHNATSREDSFWVDFANAIEAKLKELNT